MNELDKIKWKFFCILVVIYGIAGGIAVYKLDRDILNLKNKVKHLEEKHEIQPTMAKK
jgi:hypothetical protein